MIKSTENTHLIKFEIFFVFILVLMGQSVLTTSITLESNNSIDKSNPNVSDNADPIQFNVIDVRQWELSDKEMYLLSSFEGFVNNLEENLFIIYNANDEQWVFDLNSSFYNATMLEIDSLEELFNEYPNHFDGIIIWDDLPESANVATPLVRAYNSVLVHESIYSTIQSWSAFSDKLIKVNLTEQYHTKGFSQSSTKAQVYQWAFETYYDLSNPDGLGMIDSKVSHSIRSQLCAEGLFTFYQPMYCDGDETAPRNLDEDLAIFEYIIENTPENIIVYGYMFPRGCNEHPVVSRLSAQGKYLIPSDWSSNLPFWSNLPIPEDYTFSQNPSRDISNIPLENKLYVAGIYSDGDNLQYIQSFMKRNLWDNRHGSVPTTYELTPSLFEITPAIAMVYYEQMTTNDYFVTGVGGKAYVKADYTPESIFHEFWRDTRDLMIKLDQRELRSWDSGDTEEIIDIMKDTQGNNILDSIIEGYMGSRDFKAYTVNNTPFMRMREFTAENRSRTFDEKILLNEIVKTIRHQPEFLTLHIHCWSTPYEVWEEFVKTMEEESGGDIVFVTSGQLSQLMLQANIGNPNEDYAILNVFILVGLAFFLLTHVIVPKLKPKEIHEQMDNDYDDNGNDKKGDKIEEKRNLQLKKGENARRIQDLTVGILLLVGVVSVILITTFIENFLIEVIKYLTNSSIKPFLYLQNELVLYIQLSMGIGFIIYHKMKEKIKYRKETREFLYLVLLIGLSVSAAFGLGYLELVLLSLLFTSLSTVFILAFAVKLLYDFLHLLVKSLSKKSKDNIEKN